MARHGRTFPSNLLKKHSSLPYGAAAVSITGVLNVTEAPDAAVFNATSQWLLVLNATEAPDTANP